MLIFDTFISECRKIFADYPESLKITDQHICTGLGNFKEQQMCPYDSGMPLVLFNDGEYEEIGIPTWTPLPCGIPRPFPTVYARVSAHVDFIESIVGEDLLVK